MEAYAAYKSFCLEAATEVVAHYMAVWNEESGLPKIENAKGALLTIAHWGGLIYSSYGTMPELPEGESVYVLIAFPDYVKAFAMHLVGDPTWQQPEGFPYTQEELYEAYNEHLSPGGLLPYKASLPKVKV